MPEIVHRANAHQRMNEWIRLHLGFPNPNLECCYCGEYRLKYDDENCTDPDHYSHKVEWRCGRHATRHKKDGTPFLCTSADRYAVHVIPGLAFPGLCPYCPHSAEDQNEEFLRQQRRRQSERAGQVEQDQQDEQELNIEQRLQQEQLSLFREARERQEATRQAGHQ
ncbi:hypothetical protein F5Y10DRAFT_265083 [Nemania abortiva]|nr:hypothetical protein F5Y10DRAFT_265083 [Nemania abortiva]